MVEDAGHGDVGWVGHGLCSGPTLRMLGWAGGEKIFWPSVSVMLNDDCLSQLIQAQSLQRD